MIQQNDIIDTKHLTTTETDTINYGKTNSVEKGHPLPTWFQEEYGQTKKCAGWYVEINNDE